ncbi:hypothetical protein KAFR_0A07430 [Kazachstania africana CBS 2517]|uniref:Uncharacterized protein n=1 Tax=Kazachstania africana (strain ATCC 22294 / BCRC 22015 / CBS 2517 / CECT 1963 / NBRC 1671 / NRRL Y-8276) TaxID=1071382 RepID=H2AP77_KAZAF|nr:hypothetical protein KAFR_0A07430 [Kazachstania africana CBS 2517]CCF56177.1 hypothetical protein KAFR_0A07430 [Kazachstania africana CBS 2517]
MGLDEEKIKKRLSQIELDIDQMNQMIDDNLLLSKGEQGVSEAEDEVKQSKLHEVTDVETGSDTYGDADDGFAVEVEEGNGDNAKSISNTEASVEKDVQDERVDRVEGLADVIEENNVEVKELTNQDKDGKIEEEEATAEEDEITAEQDVNNEGVSEEVEDPHDSTHSDDVTLEDTTKSNDGEKGPLGDKTQPIQEENESQWEEIDENTEEAKTTSIQDKIVAQSIETAVPAFSDKESSPDGNLGEDDKIVLPKKDNGDNNATNNPRIFSNPFRVISVSSPASATSSRKSSLDTKSTVVKKTQEQENVTRLQKRHDYLINKCMKLNKEIDYLNKMMLQGNLDVGDNKKLKLAISKLQQYYDEKNKEKYEVGVILSRQLRKQINNGENGQFWVGSK